MIFLVFEDKTEIGIDATSSLSPQYQSETTDHEIEDGSLITDHVVRMPATLQLEGFMSNVPLTMTGEYKFDNDGYHNFAADKFQKAWANAERMAVDAGHRGYFDNLVITSFSINWDYQHGSGLPFSMSFKRLNFVESERTFFNLGQGAGSALGGAGGFFGALPGDAQETAVMFSNSSITGVVGTLPETTRQAGRMAGITPTGTDFFRGP